MTPGDSVPTDPDALRALLLAERTHHAEELERLTAIIRELQRHRFGRRAERLDPEQLALALEDVEQTLVVLCVGIFQNVGKTIKIALPPEVTAPPFVI